MRQAMRFGGGGGVSTHRDRPLRQEGSPLPRRIAHQERARLPPAAHPRQDSGGKGVSTHATAGEGEGDPPSSYYSPREPARASGGSTLAKSPWKGAPPPLSEPPRGRPPHPLRRTRRVSPRAPPAARPFLRKHSDKISVHLFLTKGGYGGEVQGRGDFAPSRE